MDDEKIVKLYWDRNEKAIEESQNKYGAYCNSIAYNILADVSDSEECVNDTWLHAWNAMPPHKPLVLSVFLGKITRNLSFDLYRKAHRLKRGGNQIEETLDELSDCVSGNLDVERDFEMKELMNEINQFLMGLSMEKRYMFILRYWYVESIGEIADRFDVSKNSVSINLNRIRKKLAAYLLERGFVL